MAEIGVDTFLGASSEQQGQCPSDKVGVLTGRVCAMTGMTLDVLRQTVSVLPQTLMVPFLSAIIAISSPAQAADGFQHASYQTTPDTLVASGGRLPPDVLQGGPSVIHAYLRSIRGFQYSPESFDIADAPLPLKGVVPAGMEDLKVKLSEIHIPNGEITVDTLQQAVLGVLQERADDPEYSSRWSGEVQDLVDHYPEASAKAVNALNRYVEKLQKDGKELNPYLVERAFTTIITVLKTLEVDPQLQHTNHMAFLSDVYYLLVALDIDVNGAKEHALKGASQGESYIIVPLNGPRARLLDSYVEIQIPIPFIERYNAVLEQYNIALDSMKANSRTRQVEAFNSLPYASQLEALGIFAYSLSDGSKWKGGKALKAATSIATVHDRIRSSAQETGKYDQRDANMLALGARKYMKNVPSSEGTYTLTLLSLYDDRDAQLQYYQQQQALLHGASQAL